MRGGRSQSERWPGSDSRSPKTTAPHQLERADSYYRMRGPVIVHPPTDHPTPHPVESSSAVSTFLQPPLQRRQSASSLVNNNLVLAESGVMEMQISNMSIVDSHRRAPDPPSNTNTATTPLSLTPRAPRRVSADGNGVSLLRRPNISSSSDSDMMIR